MLEDLGSLVSTNKLQMIKKLIYRPVKVRVFKCLIMKYLEK